jgi:hypothetical protein
MIDTPVAERSDAIAKSLIIVVVCVEVIAAAQIGETNVQLQIGLNGERIQHPINFMLEECMACIPMVGGGRISGVGQHAVQLAAFFGVREAAKKSRNVRKFKRSIKKGIFSTTESYVRSLSLSCAIFNSFCAAKEGKHEKSALALPERYLCSE